MLISIVYDSGFGHTAKQAQAVSGHVDNPHELFHHRQIPISQPLRVERLLQPVKRGSVVMQTEECQDSSVNSNCT